MEIKQKGNSNCDARDVANERPTFLLFPITQAHVTN